MQFQLVRPLMPGSARSIDGERRRFTEVVLNEQALPAAGMKLSRLQDATFAAQAKNFVGSHPGAPGSWHRGQPKS